MRKMTGFCMIGLLALFIGTFGAGVAGASTTLTYSSFFPPTHIQSQLSEAWCEEVEKRTEGRVKVQYFPGQTLTKANRTYDSIVDGIADVGIAALAYTQGRFPVMGAIDLPFGYANGVVATKVANDLYAALTPKEFDATQVMYFNAHGPGFIHTRKKPIRTLEDLRGMRIRSTGMSADVVRALGATPVTMAMPDTYQSLQRGVVDGSAHPVETNAGWKMGEVVDYVTYAYPAAYTTNFFVVMNKAKWNALSEQDRAIIEEINLEWAQKHGEAWDSSDEEGEAFFLGRKGNEIIKLDDAESARWGAAVAPLIDDYAKKLSADGFDGEAVVAKIRELLETHK